MGRQRRRGISNRATTRNRCRASLLNVGLSGGTPQDPATQSFNPSNDGRTIMTQAVDRLVRHVAATRFQDLPAAAVAAVKTFCLDTIGVSVAGTAARYAAEMRAAVDKWGDGDEATALGLRETLPASSAAMVNAFHAHNQEFDCVHEAAVVHPLTTIQSAALAVAERAGGVSGQALILALALGVDVAASIGMAAKTGLRFFRPATAGVFGATAAVGKLAGLDAVGLKNALGLAYAQNAGTMQSHVEGGPALALQMGFAAGAAVRAVDLARAGLPGPHDVLEGPFGYFRLYEGEWDLEPAWAELGTVWRITQVSHKPFPTGRGGARRAGRHSATAGRAWLAGRRRHPADVSRAAVDPSIGRPTRAARHGRDLRPPVFPVRRRPRPAERRRGRRRLQPRTPRRPALARPCPAHRIGGRRQFPTPTLSHRKP